ncbi:hypothetical protein BDP81DRAFT_184929 [Colletotrichum phormii]|uniref:Uncharacterized protein n=1 Tax=Colletotrichum phormii TaxID=359342 RepID=A0AAJ0A0G0_9PEZI|nr:uncharacterized protein BDP81DRAFT_184929 [Colletotrichum phormii]KAK1639887.1 hypothetical protein BDP81DRAFT_184929 [Colletotrichum phormii]
MCPSICLQAHNMQQQYDSQPPYLMLPATTDGGSPTGDDLDGGHDNYDTTLVSWKTDHPSGCYYRTPYLCTSTAHVGYSVDRSRRRRCRVIGLQSSTVITVGSGAFFLFRKIIGNERECASAQPEKLPTICKETEDSCKLRLQVCGLRPRNLRDFVESRPNARPRNAYDEQRGLRSPGTSLFSTLLKFRWMLRYDRTCVLLKAQHHRRRENLC